MATHDACIYNLNGVCWLYQCFDQIASCVEYVIVSEMGGTQRMHYTLSSTCNRNVMLALKCMAN